MEYTYQNLPKVSIVIPTKNRCSLLCETLESITNQTYSNWEAVVVDDGSTDRTIEQMLALSKQEPRIRFLRRSSTKCGASVCRNEGVAVSTGEYVIFLDSDDCLAPSCLQNRVDVMQANPSIDLAVFPCQLFRVMPGDLALLWNAQTQENDIDRFLSRDVPWQTTSPIWKRQALTQVGPWDESLLSWQDWEFHFRALILGLNYKKFSEPDCFWRWPENESIGLKSVTPDHLYSHERLFSKVHSMLCEAQLIDVHRQYILAGLYFWLANRWASSGGKKEAARVWKVCQEKKIIGNIQYREGLFYFRAQNVRLAERLARKYLEIRWPIKLIGRNSITFRKTPLNHDQELHSQLEKA